MNKKTLFNYWQFLAICLLFATNIQAQNEEDVMRYSFLDNASTARAKALGGAMGSIGADFSGISVNPASLGRYSKNEFSFTYAPKFYYTKTTFYNSPNSAENSKAAMDNIGIVIASKNETSKWKSSSFAVGLNSQGNFNRAYSYGGTSTSSITDYWANISNESGGYANITNQNESIGLAFNTGLIDTAGGNLYSIMPDALQINQRKNVVQSGYAKEIIVSLAGNKNDKWLVGGTFGVPLINYNNVTTISENDLSGNPSNFFSSMQRNETLLTSGGGINFKFGVIHTPTRAIRIGASLASPSLLSLTDVYNLSVDANTENAFGSLSSSITPIKFEYQINTPAKALVSGSYIFGGKGFITADYELVNYAGAKIVFADFPEVASVINTRIRTNYKAASNIRLGAEWRLKNWSIRGGYAQNGSPLKQLNYNNNQYKYSAGVGYRFKSFFVDGAMVKISQRNIENLYKISGLQNEASIRKNDVQLALTAGWKF
jgi:hypothetical protein